MNTVIVSWIGETDIKMFESAEVGPVDGLLANFDTTTLHFYLLFNYAYERVDALINHLADKYPTFDITPVSTRITNPTSYSEIYPISFNLLTEINQVYADKSFQLHLFLSPGTPTMQAVWVLLAKTYFPAVCWSGYKGAYSVVELPFKMAVEYIQAAENKLDSKLQDLMGSHQQSKSFQTIIGQSSIIQTQLEKAHKLSQRNVPTLILGPTGSGKEVFAKAIHGASQQSRGGFVAVNCGALPKDLAESILFGHKRGAFTGAISDQDGLIKQADGGTLFLDEIGELSLDLQVKLLRVLQEKTFRPLGAKKEESSSFRLISATHQDLLEKITNGSFREDLFYRIAIGVLKLPSLIERGNDIELISQYLLQQINQELADQPGYVGKEFSKEVNKVIKEHAWPGNIRELRATILRVCAWSDNKIITAEEFADALIQRDNQTNKLLLDDIGQGVDLDEKIRDLQLYYIEKSTLLTGGQITKMAKLLGFKNHQTLKKRMESLGIT